MNDVHVTAARATPPLMIKYTQFGVCLKQNTWGITFLIKMT